MSKNIENVKKTKNLRRILSYVKTVKFMLAIGIIFMITSIILSSIIPIINMRIFDDYLLNSSITSDEMFDGAIKLIIIQISITLAVVVIDRLTNIFIDIGAYKFEKNIRMDTIRKLKKLPMSYYVENPDGKILTRVNDDVGFIGRLLSTYIRIFYSVATFVVSYYAIYKLDSKFAIYILIVLPLLAVWFKFMQSVFKKANKQIRERYSVINGQVNEMIVGTQMLQTLTKTGEVLGEFEDEHVKLNSEEYKISKIGSYFGYEALLLIIRIVKALLVIYFGFMILDTNVASVGLILAYFTYIDRIISPINTIMQSIGNLSSSHVAASRVFDLLDEEEIEESKKGLKLAKLDGDIEFKNVSFEYAKKDGHVLNNVNFKVKNGDVVSIVGHTGSGKSTVMNLLMNFYKVTSGDITINGTSLYDFDRQSYADRTAVILQRPGLFKGTIKSNVTLDKKATDQEIEDLFKRMGTLNLFTKFDKGINTEIDAGGSTLSSGQKQVIAFARALYKNPDLLVLDEATSNIDTETESTIQKALDVVVNNRTTIIIAHRLSTIKNADMIIVLDKGVVADIGTHKSLLKSSAIYSEMYEAQMRKQKKSITTE